MAIGIPLLLILCGAIIKKLVRSTSWTRKDFYFGSELTLTALGAALLNLYDLANAAKGKISSLKDNLLQLFSINAGFVLFSLVILLVLVALHQDWENRTGNVTGQFLRLTVAGNLIGIFMFACFVIWVKGV
ncbi:hypothetical protein [Pantoea sp.]|uniref:hypothetical protein n=1 Tax=Pantoea TaxID=53335 RepID=UPI0025DF941C|nr:hypothetical protein [Pantoea sp.]